MPDPLRQSSDATAELRYTALLQLCEPDPAVKVATLRALPWASLTVDRHATWAEPDMDFPGRPKRPVLVPPPQLARRSTQTIQGRAILLHAVAHIELNAIHLALDAVWRFAGLPTTFYRDWMQVAQDEARHFSLLAAHLETLGAAYGDFPAHNALWEMADRTRGDVLARMALVPRTLEARGLDATPAMRAKLAQAGDDRAAKILDVILHDEIGHVAIGNRWFHWLCAERELDPLVAFTQLQVEHRAPKPRGPFNMPARRAAGFTPAELAALEADAAVRPTATVRA